MTDPSDTPTSQVEFDRSGSTGEVILKLSPRGLYSWSIKLPIDLEKPLKSDRDFGQKVCNQLDKIDRKLKEHFPSHAKKGTGRVKTIDAFGLE